MHTTRPLRTLLALSALTLGLAACGGGTDEPAETPTASPEPSAAAPAFSIDIDGVGEVAADPVVAATLPADVAEAASLDVATNAPYPPFIDFVEEGNTEDFTGFEYDLVTAIAARLGIEAPFQQQPFDGLVPGLQAGKYDAIVGGITDNFERQEVATFVDTSASGTGILVVAGNPNGIATLEDLCGREVAVQKAAKQVDLLKDFSEESCGGEAIIVTEYPQNPDALNALLADKAAAFVATKVNLLDIAAKRDGSVEVVEDPEAPNGYQASPNGIGFLRERGDLAEAFRVSLQSLIEDGTYDAIMAKWEQEAIALDEATIDNAVD
jgi:polar amino acid transport system substrate-binding protein